MNLTQDEALEAALATSIVLARRDLLEFSQLIDPGYTTPEHIKLIASDLEAIERGDILREIIIMPPRHGKSEITSGKFPGWFIGRDPSRKIITTTYGATLAETFSLQVRDTIANNPFYSLIFPKVTISPKTRAADKWAVLGQRETLIAAGVGGAITGFGAHLLLIDDPFKDYAEASSPAQQLKVYQWYKTTSRTRLMKGGAIIIITTRWAEGDLVGRILNSDEADDWNVLHLPAVSLGESSEYTDLDELKRLTDSKAAQFAFPDPLGRPRGEPLWPEMGFDTAFLNKSRRVMGHDFQGLYQGMPGAVEGEKFKKEDFRSTTEGELKERGYKKVACARSWDLAFSEKESADNTVGLLGSLYISTTNKGDGRPAPSKPGDGLPLLIVIENVVDWKKEWDEGSEDLIKVTIEDGEDVSIVIEAVASQNTAFKSVRRDPRLWKHTIQKYTPQKDKFERAQQAIRLASHGFVNILYPNASSPPSWELDFLDELGVFPNGEHDDRVDAFTQLINIWSPIIDQIVIAVVPTKVKEEGPTFLKKLPHEFREATSTPARDRNAWKIGNIFS